MRGPKTGAADDDYDGGVDADEGKHTGGDKPILSSKYRGVCWNRKNRRWQAAINSSGKYVYLGSFVEEEEAARAFDRAAVKLRGKKAKLNFLYEDYVDERGNLLEDPKMERAMGKIQALKATPNDRTEPATDEPPEAPLTLDLTPPGPQPPPHGLAHKDCPPHFQARSGGLAMPPPHRGCGSDGTTGLGWRVSGGSMPLYGMALNLAAPDGAVPPPRPLHVGMEQQQSLFPHALAPGSGPLHGAERGGGGGLAPPPPLILPPAGRMPRPRMSSHPTAQATGPPPLMQPPFLGLPQPPPVVAGTPPLFTPPLGPAGGPGPAAPNGFDSQPVAPTLHLGEQPCGTAGSGVHPHPPLPRGLLTSAAAAAAAAGAGGAVQSAILSELPDGCTLMALVPNRSSKGSNRPNKEEIVGALYHDRSHPGLVGSSVWTGSSIIRMGHYDTERDARQAAIKCMQLYLAFCSGDWQVEFYNALSDMGAAAGVATAGPVGPPPAVHGSNGHGVGDGNAAHGAGAAPPMQAYGVRGVAHRGDVGMGVGGSGGGGSIVQVVGIPGPMMGPVLLDLQHSAPPHPQHQHLQQHSQQMLQQQQLQQQHMTSQGAPNLTHVRAGPPGPCVVGGAANALSLGGPMDGRAVVDAVGAPPVQPGSSGQPGYNEMFTYMAGYKAREADVGCAAGEAAQAGVAEGSGLGLGKRAAPDGYAPFQQHQQQQQQHAVLSHADPKRTRKDEGPSNGMTEAEVGPCNGYRLAHEPPLAAVTKDLQQAAVAT